MSDIHSQKEQREEALVRQQGEAYGASYDILMHEDPHAVTEIDDYCITVSFEPAEGMYVPHPDLSLAWATPAQQENQHLEVIVRDREDGRFLPYMDVTLWLYDENNNIVLQKHVPFIWHPFVFHYGIDGSIPGEGNYTPEVFIKRPLFRRHDEARGKRYTRDVRVKLGKIHLTPGKKAHGPE